MDFFNLPNLSSPIKSCVTLGLEQKSAATDWCGENIAYAIFQYLNNCDQVGLW